MMVTGLIYLMDVNRSLPWQSGKGGQKIKLIAIAVRSDL